MQNTALTQKAGPVQPIAPTKAGGIRHKAPSKAPTLAARLQALSQIEAGWREGQGVAYNAAELAWLANQFKECYPANLPTPEIAPTAEGAIVLEWDKGDHVVFLDINPATRQGEWLSYQPPDQEEVEKTLDLNNPEDWRWMTAKIRAKLGSDHA